MRSRCYFRLEYGETNRFSRIKMNIASTEKKIDNLLAGWDTLWWDTFSNPFGPSQLFISHVIGVELWRWMLNGWVFLVPHMIQHWYRLLAWQWEIDDQRTRMPSRRNLSKINKNGKLSSKKAVFPFNLNRPRGTVSGYGVKTILDILILYIMELVI